LPAATARVVMARESDAWAISRVCGRDAILR